MGALFAAQAGGIAPTLPQQLAILATVNLTSKGVAGVPNRVILSGLFATFGLQMEASALLLRIDALIDPLQAYDSLAALETTAAAGREEPVLQTVQAARWRVHSMEAGQEDVRELGIIVPAGPDGDGMGGVPLRVS